MPAAEIQRELAKREINDVFVDWSWVNRYGSPGNYGFTDFITHSLFDRLVAEKVLRPKATALAGQSDWQLYGVISEETKH